MNVNAPFCIQWRKWILLLSIFGAVVLLIQPCCAIGSLEVTSFPSGADVYIDDIYKGTTPITLTEETRGGHAIRLSKFGYDDYKALVMVPSDNKVYAILTKQPSGYLDVFSSPPGADIYIDEILVGETNKIFQNQPEGSYKIRLKKTGYLEYFTTITVLRGISARIDVELIPLGASPSSGSPSIWGFTSATINVTSNPTEANVYLDGSLQGTTPITLTVSDNTLHDIKIEKTNYYPYFTNKTVLERRTAFVYADLEPRPSQLNIYSSPPGAIIYIDGSYKGITPKIFYISTSPIDYISNDSFETTSFNLLKLGSHSVRLAKQGYISNSTNVTISPGQISNLNLNLNLITDVSKNSTLMSNNSTDTLIEENATQLSNISLENPDYTLLPPKNSSPLNQTFSTENSFPPENFNPLVIAFVIFLVCIGGGGYYFLHSRKPSSTPPPMMDIALPSPEKVVSKKIEEEKSTTLDTLSPRVNALSARADHLYFFKHLLEPRIKILKNSLSNENLVSTENALQETESYLTGIESCEQKISEWISEGYEISPLENFQDRSIPEVLEMCSRYEQNISRLQTTKSRIASIESSNPEFVKDEDVSTRITVVKQAIRRIDNPEAAETGLRDIESFLEEFQKSLKQKEDKARVIGYQISAIKKHMDYSATFSQQLHAIEELLSAGDPVRAESALKQLIAGYTETLDRDLSELAREGAVYSLTTAHLHALIENGQYADTLTEAETVKNNIVLFRTTFNRAREINSTGKNPEIKKRFTAGNYEDVIRLHEEQERISAQVTALQQKFAVRLAEAKKTVTVPEGLERQGTAQDISTLETAMERIENFISGAKPGLSLTPEKTRFAANQWHRLPIHITNKGTAHATDVVFTFTDEFETRWIKPVTIEAGITTDVIIGLLPKQKGNIPLEIQVQYKDVNGREYQQTFEYWVEVLDSVPDAGIQTPTSFTPKSLTPRQFPPELSDRYTDWEFTGKGGFARVFKAKRKDGKYVAVKIPISMDMTTGKSFIAEMQSWTRLSHPNIVKLFDFNIMPMPYFEMELCDTSLDTFPKPVAPAKAVWLLFNICEGLKYSHANNIIHRDLKPQNILLKDSVPKISDWGMSRVIAQSTATSAAAFTPFYAAPEQIRNKPKDERTDIWQLGIILYELETGKLPFTGDDVVSLMMKITSENPEKPSEINPECKDLEPVILKCMEKDAAKRYQSVMDLQKDLAAFIQLDFSQSLKQSRRVKDFKRSAYFCSDLMLVSLKTGDIAASLKYASDLVTYTDGEIRASVQDLADQLRIRIESNMEEIPNELIIKADIIAHKVKLRFGTL